MLLEEATLHAAETFFKEAVLDTELLFKDKAAAVFNELFFEDTVLVVVEQLLEMMVDVTTGEAFTAAAANDGLTLVVTSSDITQFVLPFNITPVSIAESFFKHEPAVDTVMAFFTEGSDTGTVQSPGFRDAAAGLIFGAIGLEVTISEVLEEQAPTLDISTVRTGGVTGVGVVSEDDVAGGSQGVDSNVNASVLFSQTPAVASFSGGSTFI